MNTFSINKVHAVAKQSKANTATAAQQTSTGMLVHHSGTSGKNLPGAGLVTHRRTVQTLLREVAEPEVPQQPDH